MPRPRATLGGRPAALVAGVLAGAVAIGAGELVSGLGGSQLSPVTAVGNRIIDHVPTGLREWAISTFGTSDKAVLVGGILAVAALIAGGLGFFAAHRFAPAAAGFVAFGAVGVAAVVADPLGGAAAAAGAATGALAGVAALRALIAVPAAFSPGSGSAVDDPSRPDWRVDRRAFLWLAGGAAVVAGAAAMTGRLLQQRGRAAASRLAVVLPAPRRALPDVADGASLEADGLSALFTPNGSFYRIDTALFVPQVPAEGWQLRVEGMVGDPLTITYDDLLARPLVERDITLACVSNEVGGSLVGNARWLGVPLLDLLEEAGIDPDADQVVGRSVDGFTAGFPVDALRDGRPALVAVGMNGEPLPLDHGFPARLVVAGIYGYVSATKWLSAIELTRFDRFSGYWIPRGWAREGPVKTMARIDTPRGGTVRAGTVAVAGVAWAPTRGIERVEVQVDDGPWLEAELSDELADAMWRQWLVRWRATPGRHRLTVRATDGTGEVQSQVRDDPFPDGATGWHRVAVTVEG